MDDLEERDDDHAQTMNISNNDERDARTPATTNVKRDPAASSVTPADVYGDSGSEDSSDGDGGDDDHERGDVDTESEETEAKEKNTYEEEGESEKDSVRAIDDAFEKTVDETLEAEENASKMMSVVAELDEMCGKKRMTSEAFVEEVEKRLTAVEFLDVDEIAATTDSSAAAARGVKRCRRTFWDFGTNVGDDVGRFVDTNFANCEKRNESVALFDLTTDGHHHHPRYFRAAEPNNVTKAFRNILSNQNAAAHNYCVYAAERNPVFTQRLRKAEEFVMTNMHTRPMQNLHFLESFFGRNVQKNNENVVGSRKRGKEIKKTHEVTLSALLKQTLIAFSPDVWEEEKKGGHLVIKVDIEDGMHHLIEVAKSGVLCDFKNMGNHVDLIVDFQHYSLTNATLGRGYSEENIRHKLEKCGLTMNTFQSYWR